MLVQFSKRLGIGKGGVECIAEAHLFYVPKKPSDYFILNSSAHSGAILIFRMYSALRIADCRSNHDGVTPAAAAARLISASSLLPMIMCLRCFFVLGFVLVVILIFIESESAKCTSPSQTVCIAVFINNGVTPNAKKMEELVECSNVAMFALSEHMRAQFDSYLRECCRRLDDGTAFSVTVKIRRVTARVA